MKLPEDEIIKLMKEALEEQKKIPPEKRFQALIDSGLIDENGNLVRDKEETLKEKEALNELTKLSQELGQYENDK